MRSPDDTGVVARVSVECRRLCVVVEAVPSGVRVDLLRVGGVCALAVECRGSLDLVRYASRQASLCNCDCVSCHGAVWTQGCRVALAVNVVPCGHSWA